jgi:hypothetical protein
MTFRDICQCVVGSLYSLCVLVLTIVVLRILYCAFFK